MKCSACAGCFFFMVDTVLLLTVYIRRVTVDSAMQYWGALAVCGSIVRSFCLVAVLSSRGALLNGRVVLPAVTIGDNTGNCYPACLRSVAFYVVKARAISGWVRFF